MLLEDRCAETSVADGTPEAPSIKDRSYPPHWYETMTRTRELDGKTTARLLGIAIQVGALVPLALLLWDYWLGQLGADPIREITSRTGKPALILLGFSLACTPLNIMFGWTQPTRLRKPLGLYSFLYASLHVLTFLWLDYGLDPGLIAEVVLQKRYALAGGAAFLLLVLLAATSNRWSKRKLGKRWKELHRLAYVIGVLAAVHFLWLVKNAYTEPLIFAAILGMLLLIRVKPIRQKIACWRHELKEKSVGRSASVV